MRQEQNHFQMEFRLNFQVIQDMKILNLNLIFLTFLILLGLGVKEEQLLWMFKVFLKIKNTYLTDPACQSPDQKFSSTDLGTMGLCKFLLCHKHNDIFAKWKWQVNNFKDF